MRINPTTKTFPFRYCGEERTAKLLVRRYAQPNNLALSIVVEDEEYGEEDVLFSVNIVPLPEGMTALDRNNYESYGLWQQIIELIRDNELGICRGEIPSGYCMYPVFQFDIEKLKALATYEA